MIIFSIVVLLVALFLGIFFLSKVVPLGASELNFISYQYYMHFVLLVIPGSIMILLGNRSDLALLPLSNATVIYCSLAIAWCVFIFPFTMFMLDKISRQQLKIKIKNYNQYNVVHHSQPEVTLRNIKIITIFNTSLLLIFLSMLPTIPIFHIGAGSEFLMNSRLESAFDLPAWLYGFRRILVYYLPIFLLFVLAFNSVKKVPKWIFLLCFINAFLVLGYSTEKAPIIFLIFSIFFMKNLLPNSYNLSFFKLLPLLILFLTLLISMFMFFYQNTLSEALDGFISRLFVGQIAGSYLSMEYFGSIAPFKYFNAVFFRLDELLGNNATMQASEELVYYYYYELYINNLWRNVNSFIIQGAWSNFGWFGVFFAPIWCAIIIYSLILYVVNHTKTASTLAIYSYSTIFMVSLSTNFNNFMYSSGFILTICLWLMLRKI